MNEKGLTVNTSMPSGGVSTTEYNAYNEAIRTLSPDNQARAMAEGCKSVEEKECKSSAEISEQLDTKTEYSLGGSDVVKVVGPEHNVKLASGAEVQARAVTHYFYNKGAKEVEEKTHETYNLVTQTVEGALLSNGEEKNPRETVTSYSGQEDLGWKLRKPTSETKEPGGLNLTATTVYQESENTKKEKESTGAVVETRSVKGSSSAPAPVFMAQFGSEGSASGEFKKPQGDAVDASGDLWVADGGNDRVEKFGATGQFIASYGSAGKGEDQFSDPDAVSINQSTGNVYIGDSGNNRIEELSFEGKFIRSFGEGKLSDPDGVAIDSSGSVSGFRYGGLCC